MSFLWAVETEPVNVLRVYDGDTITIEAHVGGSPLPIGVRLLYLDTPELRGNSHGAAMPEGKAAADHLKALIAVGSQVRLWSPEEELKTDRYGRLLAVVILADGTTAQESMIAAGWSALWEKYGGAHERYRDALQAAEDAAKEGRVGAWGTARQWMQNRANETTAPKK